MTSSCLKLSEIFRSQHDFAWRLLDAQCQIQIKRNITIEDVTALSELYMKAVEKLNTLQDERQKYFSQKMQKLMAQPYVIRCFNNKNQGKKNEMQYKRKEIQQILSHQNEKARPERLQQMISQYSEKQRKIKSKIDKIIQDHEKALENRIKKRIIYKSDRQSFLQGSDIGSRIKKGKNSQNQSKRDAIAILPFNPQSSRSEKSTSSQVLQGFSP